MTKEEAAVLIRRTINDWGTITINCAGDVVDDQEFGSEPTEHDCEPDTGEQVIVYRVEFIPVRIVSKSVVTKEFE